MTITVTKDVWNEIKASQRQDLRKGILNAEEVMAVLGIGKTEFYEIAASSQTQLRRSSLRGKYIWSSVKEEFKRLHGVSYEEAIA